MRGIAVVAAVLVCALAPSSVRAAEPGERSAAPARRVVVGTGKERLGDKASDEQRVDDCKVPPGRRTRARPTACPWDAGS